MGYGGRPEALLVTCALVLCSASAVAETEGVKVLMGEFVIDSRDYTAQWQFLLDRMKALAPVSRVMLEDYGSPELNAIAIYNARFRLCAAALSKMPRPFLVSGDNPRLQLRLTHMLPAVAKILLSKYSQFARRLDLAAGDASMIELTRRSPTKAEPKAIGRQLQEVAKQAEEGRVATAMELDKTKAQLATEVCLF